MASKIIRLLTWLNPDGCCAFAVFAVGSETVVVCDQPPCVACAAAIAELSSQRGWRPRIG